MLVILYDSRHVLVINNRLILLNVNWGISLILVCILIVNERFMWLKICVVIRLLILVIQVKTEWINIALIIIYRTGNLTAPVTNLILGVV